ncbi:hypothetical protein BDK51DRAFT_41117 [Blyttiomyces helicus]|uniref:3'-5' exonuclease domain-containing protein n=1 Tax=Blyttiomyces helicus TaxID=388810 RepID=A0A4P9WJD2_9FUNG|nr:hypothetical protein BDK51DRAFT_41117 [Blyttiomyces helicus]|eukprot:RKO92472.1 hypothetical protein BDK51DRAFT_41117 [Blyttiomyces helicus]
MSRQLCAVAHNPRLIGCPQLAPLRLPARLLGNYSAWLLKNPLAPGTADGRRNAQTRPKEEPRLFQIGGSHRPWRANAEAASPPQDVSDDDVMDMMTSSYVPSESNNTGRGQTSEDSAHSAVPPPLNNVPTYPGTPHSEAWARVVQPPSIGEGDSVASSAITHTTSTDPLPQDGGEFPGGDDSPRSLKGVDKLMAELKEQLEQERSARLAAEQALRAMLNFAPKTESREAKETPRDDYRDGMKERWEVAPNFGADLETDAPYVRVTQRRVINTKPRPTPWKPASPPSPSPSPPTFASPSTRPSPSPTPSPAPPPSASISARSPIPPSPSPATSDDPFTNQQILTSPPPLSDASDSLVPEIIQRLEARGLHPHLSKPYNIFVFETSQSAEVFMEVIEQVNGPKGLIRTIGVDTETPSRPPWSHAAGGPPSMLQIAFAEGLVGLFMIYRMCRDTERHTSNSVNPAKFPRRLRAFLTKTSIVKTGVAVDAVDGDKLEKYYNIKMSNTFPLEEGGKAIGIPVSLKSLASSYCGWDLQKGGGNHKWESSVAEIGEKSVLYAAHDALAGLRVFRRMVRAPEPDGQAVQLAVEASLWTRDRKRSAFDRIPGESAKAYRKRVTKAPARAPVVDARHPWSTHETKRPAAETPVPLQRTMVAAKPAPAEVVSPPLTRKEEVRRKVELAAHASKTKKEETKMRAAQDKAARKAHKRQVAEAALAAFAQQKKVRRMATEAATAAQAKKPQATTPVAAAPPKMIERRVGGWDWLNDSKKSSPAQPPLLSTPAKPAPSAAAKNANEVDNTSTPHAAFWWADRASLERAAPSIPPSKPAKASPTAPSKKATEADGKSTERHKRMQQLYLEVSAELEDSPAADVGPANLRAAAREGATRIFAGDNRTDVVAAIVGRLNASKPVGASRESEISEPAPTNRGVYPLRSLTAYNPQTPQTSTNPLPTTVITKTPTSSKRVAVPQLPASDRHNLYRDVHTDLSKVPKLASDQTLLLAAVRDKVEWEERNPRENPIQEPHLEPSPKVIDAITKALKSKPLKMSTATASIVAFLNTTHGVRFTDPSPAELRMLALSLLTELQPAEPLRQLKLALGPLQRKIHVHSLKLRAKDPAGTSYNDALKAALDEFGMEHKKDKVSCLLVQELMWERLAVKDEEAFAEEA